MATGIFADNQLNIFESLVMNDISLKGKGNLDQLVEQNYQNLDTVQDVSLYRICQLSSIICG